MAPKGERIQAAELEWLRLASQVGPVETIPKAQEILRLMGTKCRPGSLGRGDLCRTAIAFDLACRALACPVPHKTAVKLSGLASEALYVTALGTAQRLLGLQQRFTCEEIADSVGGRRVGAMAASELKRYKVAQVDLDGAVYAVSAFYLCAKKLKHPVDKQRLLDLSLVTEAEFAAVCRSMLELCYSTLGVSVSDKPSAERLAQFEKTAAAAAAAAPRASSSGRHKNGGSGAGSGERRRIPLSSASGRGGLGAPSSHIAHLARSIQNASQRKRYGGMTIAPPEPGGRNETNDSLHDRTHRPKRPRGSGAVHNPYAAKPATAPAPAPATAPADSRATPGGDRGGARGGGGEHAGSSGRGGAAETAGSETGGQEKRESERKGEGDGEGEGEPEQQPRGGQEYAEWKERVLASMENRIKGNAGPPAAPSSSSSSCPSAASGTGTSNPSVAGAAGTGTDGVPASAPTPGDDSKRTPAAAPAPAPAAAAAKRTKQASLTSFFAPPT